MDFSKYFSVQNIKKKKRVRFSFEVLPSFSTLNIFPKLFNVYFPLLFLKGCCKICRSFMKHSSKCFKNDFFFWKILLIFNSVLIIPKVLLKFIQISLISPKFPRDHFKILQNLSNPFSKYIFRTSQIFPQRFTNAILTENNLHEIFSKISRNFFYHFLEMFPKLP